MRAIVVEQEQDSWLSAALARGDCHIRLVRAIRDEGRPATREL